MELEEVEKEKDPAADKKRILADGIVR